MCQPSLCRPNTVGHPSADSILPVASKPMKGKAERVRKEMAIKEVEEAEFTLEVGGAASHTTITLKADRAVSNVMINVRGSYMQHLSQRIKPQMRGFVSKLF